MSIWHVASSLKSLKASHITDASFLIKLISYESCTRRNNFISSHDEERADKESKTNFPAASLSLKWFKSAFGVKTQQQVPFTAEKCSSETKTRRKKSNETWECQARIFYETKTFSFIVPRIMLSSIQRQAIVHEVGVGGGEKDKKNLIRSRQLFPSWNWRDKKKLFLLHFLRFHLPLLDSRRRNNLIRFRKQTRNGKRALRFITSPTRLASGSRFLLSNAKRRSIKFKCVR